MFKTIVLLKLQIHRILTAVMLGVFLFFPDLMNGQIRWATKDPRAILFNIELKFVIANLVALQIIETLTNWFCRHKNTSSLHIWMVATNNLSVKSSPELKVSKIFFLFCIDCVYAFGPTHWCAPTVYILSKHKNVLIFHLKISIITALKCILVVLSSWEELRRKSRKKIHPAKIQVIFLALIVQYCFCSNSEIRSNFPKPSRSFIMSRCCRHANFIKIC